MTTEEIKALPIYSKEEEIVETVRENPVTIIVGETGSGKTTQLPVMLEKHEIGMDGVLAMTEPRTIAAISVSKFVAENLGHELGKEVGFETRFARKFSPETSIFFMTDGILLKEFKKDPLFSDFSVIVIDEAHERSSNIDLLLALIKSALPKRPDLKLIVTSATIDSEKFSRYFDSAPVIEVSGRTHPVEDVWLEHDLESEEVLGKVAETVRNIHYHEDEGDILVFLTGGDEIAKVQKELEVIIDLEVLPCYAGLPPEEQDKIFHDYPDKRKVILATNIAETSITIAGVVYVVDSGRIKQSHFSPRYGIKSLDVVLHSQSGTNQRAGRAGRTQPGVCYRMYTKFLYNKMEEHTKPEIQRISLVETVLQMTHAGIEDVRKLDLIDRPRDSDFELAYEQLKLIGALDEDEKLTEDGEKMAHMPIDPVLSKMILEAQKFGCTAEVAVFAACLSTDKQIFFRPMGKEDKASAAHAQFKVGRSDALMYYKIYRKFVEEFQQGSAKKWCYDNFLNFRSLKQIDKILNQFIGIFKRNKIDITSSGDEYDIRLSIATGLVSNLFRDNIRGYDYTRVLDRLGEVYIFPGSSLMGSNPQFMVASELRDTSKLWADGCTEVNPEWLPELLPEFFFFGDEKILSVDFEAREAEIAETVYFRRSSHTREPEMIAETRDFCGLEDAALIQRKAVEAAKASGYMFVKFPEHLGSSVQIGSESYYLAAHHNVRPGSGYYCRISAGSVTPIFEVFDFGEGESFEAELRKPAEASDAESLAKAWGASVRGK